jgi:hypothetical protein
MRRRWLLIGGIVVFLFVCAMLADMASSLNDAFVRQMKGSQIGRIARYAETITPEVQQRDKEVEELTHP